MNILLIMIAIISLNFLLTKILFKFSNWGFKLMDLVSSVLISGILSQLEPSNQPQLSESSAPVQVEEEESEESKPEATEENTPWLSVQSIKSFRQHGHNIYQVEVLDIRTGASHQIDRRFREFAALRKALLRHSKSGHNCCQFRQKLKQLKMPPRWNLFSRKHLAERPRLLCNFLQDILALGDHCDTNQQFLLDEISLFLRLDEQRLQ